MKYKAFLFDLNGTMIDDMQYHIEAWHKILNELGASITMEQMNLLLSFRITTAAPISWENQSMGEFVAQYLIF